MPERAIPPYITSLIRHFEDLRDGTHGGSASREGKEAHFENAVHLLAPIARQVLTLPPPSSSRDDRLRLAAERVQRRGCRGPAPHTPGDRVQRSAQSGLPCRLSDRPCGDGRSRYTAHACGHHPKGLAVTYLSGRFAGTHAPLHSARAPAVLGIPERVARTRPALPPFGAPDHPDHRNGSNDGDSAAAGVHRCLGDRRIPDAGCIHCCRSGGCGHRRVVPRHQRAPVVRQSSAPRTSGRRRGGAAPDRSGRVLSGRAPLRLA